MRRPRAERRAVGAVSVVVAIAMLLAGCGGSGGAASSKRTASVTLGPPDALYTVRLSGRGTPAGAPAGRGYAIVALHGHSILCFRFAHLHGFTVATRAVIYTGARPGSGSLQLTPGPRLHHAGCIRLAAALWSAIYAGAKAYTVEIDSATYPAGAVRARL